MVVELISYQDELFSLLFRDISGFSEGISGSIFGQIGRRVSIYGVRGVGKTAAMQGALWIGLGSNSDAGDKEHAKSLPTPKFLPLNVCVSGARGVTNLNQLSDLFYRSVLLSAARITKTPKQRRDDILKATGKYAPWVARKLTEAAGLVFGPAALASDLSERGMKWLVERLGYSSVDSLISFAGSSSSHNLNAQHAATLLVDKLESLGATPIFTIDELDKVEDDALLSDFFDGNQTWFQGKQGMISLSYTFGESLGKTLVTSASRISRMEKFQGVSSFEDAARIIRSRVELGLSQKNETEEETKSAAEKLVPDETIKAVLNVSAPNTFIMLERMSQAIERAIRLKASVVLPEHVYSEQGKEIAKPASLEASILHELTTSGRLSPSIIAERVRRDRGLVTRTLKTMNAKDWVGRIGAGKRVYYYTTAEGEAALRRVK